MDYSPNAERFVGMMRLKRPCRFLAQEDAFVGNNNAHILFDMSKNIFNTGSFFFLYMGFFICKTCGISKNRWLDRCRVVVDFKKHFV
jgi:hypothetical protein